jgi:PAS domain S-box-containing protein
MSKRVAERWFPLFTWKSLSASVVCGLTAHLMLVSEVYIRIPGTQILTDPREIVVSLGAALSGPVGGIILGIFSGLYHAVPEFRIYVIMGHIVAAMAVGILYKMWLYERFRMPSMLFGWTILLLVYYGLALSIVAVTMQLVDHQLYVRMLGEPAGFGAELLKLYEDVIPEFILTLVITSFVFIALPSRYRRPLWGDPTPMGVHAGTTGEVKGRFRRIVAGNFLGVRLGIWFFLFSLAPAAIGAIILQQEVRTAFVTIQAMNRKEQARAISRYVVQSNASALEATLGVFSAGRRDTFFILNQEGRYVAHSDSGKVGSSALQDYPADKVKKFLSRRDSAMIDAGIGPGIGYAFVPGHNLTVVIAADPNFTQHMMGGLGWLAPERLGMGSLALSIVAGLVIWLIVGRPIRKLTSVAQELGRGNLSVDVNTAEMDDEIRVLGQAFNEMSANLRHAHRGLEEEIAERVAAGEALRQSKAQLSEVLRIAHMGYFEVDLRTMGITVSDELFASAATSAEEQGGHRYPVKEFLARFVHPDDKSLVEKSLLRVMNTPASSGASLQAEYRLRFIGGKEVWVNTQLLVYRDALGTPERIIGASQNISERKKAEIESEASKRLFQAVVENTVDAILLIDEYGRIKFVSPAIEGMLGYSPDETIGMGALEFVHPDEREEVRLTLEGTMKIPNSVSRREHRARHKDGHWVWAEAVAKNYLEAPDIRSVVVNLRDISERKRVEQVVQSIERGTVSATGEEFFKRLVLELNNALGSSCAFVGGFVQDRLDTVRTIAIAQAGSVVPNLDIDLSLTPCAAGSAEDIHWIRGDLQEAFPAFDLARQVNARSCLGVPLLSSKGHRLGILAVMFDSSAGGEDFSVALVKIFASRAGAELERMRMEQRSTMLAKVVENVSDCVTITDIENNIVFVNNAFVRTFGYEEKEVFGKSIDILRSPHLDEGLGEEIKQRTITGGWKGELWNRRKNGVEFPIELSTAVICGPDGTAIAYAGISSDITERKKAEDALRQSEVRYRSLFEAANDAIFVMNRDRFVECNSKSLEMFACARDQIIGASPWAFSPQAQPNGRLSIDAGGERIQAALDGRPQFFEWQHKTYAGKLFDAEVSLSRIELTTGPHLQAIVRDVTHRKNADREIFRLNAELERRVQERTAQLEAANKELESFSYSVSHDLRAPLRHVSGYLEILGERASPVLDEESKRYLGTASKAAVKMGALIDDLLTFSRIGRTELRKGPVDVRQLVEEVRTELSAETAGRSIEWRIGELPPVAADRQLMKLVITNLLSNAVKFTRQRTQAKIEIGTVPPAPGSEGETFFVKDNGAGFDMKYVGKLFGVFQRLHTVEEFEGTGIGLANVKRILQLHGGNVWAEAEVDGGATFYFSFHSEAKGSLGTHSSHLSQR